MHEHPTGAHHGYFRRRSPFNARYWHLHLMIAVIAAHAPFSLTPIYAQAAAPDSPAPTLATLIMEGRINRISRPATQVTGQGTAILLDGGRFALVAQHSLFICLEPARRRSGSYWQGCSSQGLSKHNRYRLPSRNSVFRIKIDNVFHPATLEYPQSLPFELESKNNSPFLEDFALLRLKKPITQIDITKPHFCINFNAPPAPKGETLTAIGIIEKPPVVSSTGAFLGFTDDDKIAISAPTWKGMSGGPVLNERGRIIGAISTTNAQNNVTILTPSPLMVERLHPFIKDLSAVECAQLTVKQD